MTQEATRAVTADVDFISRIEFPRKRLHLNFLVCCVDHVILNIPRRTQHHKSKMRATEFSDSGRKEPKQVGCGQSQNHSVDGSNPHRDTRPSHSTYVRRGSLFLACVCLRIELYSALSNLIKFVPSPCHLWPPVIRS